MLDQFGRTIEYMRISVTERCNLRCTYCMPAEGIKQMRCKDLLSYEEIIRLAKIFAELGIKKIKLTGGEPLVRLNICQLIAELKAIPQIEQVTITTNGVLLPQMAKDLIAAGLDGVNISLDSVNRESFHQLTLCDQLPNVLQGIDTLLALNFKSIKLNCVPIAGINEDQLMDIAGFAQKYPISVRFIELMPIGMAHDFTAIETTKVLSMLQERYGVLTPYTSQLGNGPATYYSLPNFKGKIGFIEAMHHKFCTNCNRVRLTSNGFLKLCLQYDKGIDLKDLLRSQKADNVIREVIEETIYQKPKEHLFDDSSIVEGKDQRNMFQVGG
ncbi:cyclic pyranopterin phosphate synthase [Propionispira arboris]|uniref:GTP 3',8-cyclase n=1 Tax=Propionispira arboris TaxID=84035 RepID=A0A1H6XNG8_9FIRM|nr:GTP 3',8-cyclase MoaA [Propionispira arboris]SEJ30621.1 cyclic pyranopterin phosphate synthase [Propionispira arboris]